MNLFKSLNFCILFVGRTINNLGDSLYYVLSMWFIYHSTHSSYYSGIAGFLILLPESFQFLVGPIITKYSPKGILIIVQIMQSFLLLVIPLLAALDHLNIYFLLTCIFFSSIFNQFNYPTHVSLLPYIVQKQDLTRANSLFTIAYQGTDTLFNSISGLLLSMIGAMYLYLYNSILFILVAFIFLFLRIPKTNQNISSISFKSYLTTLYNSFKFVFSTIVIKFLIGFVILNLTTGIILTILPAYALNKGGESYFYGFYLTSLSIGVLLGALVANYFDRFHLGKLHISMFLFSCFCFILFIYSNIIWSLVFFSLTWTTFGISNVLLLTSAQKIIKTHELGNIYTIINSISIAAMPFGSLLAGILSRYIDIHTIMIICAFLFFIVSLVWFIVKDLRTLPKSDNIKL
ncbi:MFS transporter [Staphylococcus capitis]|uniref:MFS transporter n=1 Tax=Staphylococcus capitis TaxID=29388 RepID=UPI00301ACC86